MGIVYIIECLETGEVYIGSTMRSLEDRYKDHRKCSGDCSSRRIIERGNHTARALEVVDTQDRDQLRIREQYWINQYECVNQTRAYATEEERKDQQRAGAKRYRHKNQEVVREACRRYYQENKDKAKAKAKIYNRENQEVVREACRRYYQENLDKERARARMYYEKNKDKERARKESKREWRASWNVDGRKIDATNLLDIDPKLFD